MMQYKLWDADQEDAAPGDVAVEDVAAVDAIN
jgi:hypothetical protein